MKATFFLPLCSLLFLLCTSGCAKETPTAEWRESAEYSEIVTSFTTAMEEGYDRLGTVINDEDFNFLDLMAFTDDLDALKEATGTGGLTEVSLVDTAYMASILSPEGYDIYRKLNLQDSELDRLTARVTDARERFAEVYPNVPEEELNKELTEDISAAVKEMGGSLLGL